METELQILMGIYDWQRAMAYADFTFSDVDVVVLESEGYSDGDSWLLICYLKSKKYGWLRAWCDYSGWDCQAGGESGIADTLTNAVRELSKAEAEHGERGEQRAIKILKGLTSPWTYQNPF